MPSRFQKMSKELLRNLESKITAKFMSRIENIFAEKCKAIFDEKKTMISEIANRAPNFSKKNS